MNTGGKLEIWGGPSAGDRLGLAASVDSHFLAAPPPLLVAAEDTFKRYHLRRGGRPHALDPQTFGLAASVDFGLPPSLLVAAEDTFSPLRGGLRTIVTYTYSMA